MKNTNISNVKVTIPEKYTAAAVIKSAAARLDTVVRASARATLDNMSTVETVSPSVDVVPRAPFAVPRLTFAPVVMPSAFRAAEKAMERCKVAERVQDSASMIARGVLRALCSKSGMDVSGKRPAGTRDNTAPVWTMRRELTAHIGRPGGDKYTPMAAYWDKVAAAVEREAQAEREEREHTDAAAAYNKGATAARRAGDLAAYAALKDAARRETAAARAAGAAAARHDAWEQVNSYTIGGGVDLYQIAAAYLLERLAVDGLPMGALCRGRAANGRVSVRTVGQWAAILCRRAVRVEGAALDQTAAGYTYFSDSDMDGDSLESEGGAVVRRAPHYYDMTPTADTETPAQNLETIERLTAALGLSLQQVAILSYRLKGYSRAEVAAALGTSETNVKNQLQKMREKCVKSGAFNEKALEKAKERAKKAEELAKEIRETYAPGWKPDPAKAAARIAAARAAAAAVVVDVPAAAVAVPCAPAADAAARAHRDAAAAADAAARRETAAAAAAAADAARAAATRQDAAARVAAARAAGATFADPVARPRDTHKRAAVKRLTLAEYLA